MNRLQVIQTPNRRTLQNDRRQCVDRRGQRFPGQRSGENEATLRELLRDAHARIRTLERIVEALKDEL